MFTLKIEKIVEAYGVVQLIEIFTYKMFSLKIEGNVEIVVG